MPDSPTHRKFLTREIAKPGAYLFLNRDFKTPFGEVNDERMDIFYKNTGYFLSLAGFVQSCPHASTVGRLCDIHRKGVQSPQFPRAISQGLRGSLACPGESSADQWQSVDRILSPITRVPPMSPTAQWPGLCAEGEKAG